MLAQVKSDLASGFSVLNFPKCLCEIPTRSGPVQGIPRNEHDGIPSALVRPSRRQCDAVVVVSDLVIVAAEAF